MAKILVIEDELSLLDDLLEMLKFASFDVAGAGDGHQGVALVHEWRPDLVLCDIMMPGIDGFEVLRRIRSASNTAHIPFIVLTARTDYTVQRQAMEMGADDFLIKPFSTNELLSAIASRLKRHQQVSSSSEQRLEDIKQKLARMVAHELRTPLISIKTVSDVISRQMHQLDPEEITELLQTITVGSDRLSHRVEQMVYLTQIQAGVLTAETIAKNGVPSPLWEILLAANNLARRFAFNPPPNVTVDMQDRDPGLMLLCNPPAIKHAFAELIANAITFSPPNKTVYLVQWQAEGSIIVSITDQGGGIPESQVAAAMRAFEQINRESQEQQGIGIGLTVASHIIQAHGGTLALRSVVGKGTQVIVNLPTYTAPN